MAKASLAPVEEVEQRYQKGGRKAGRMPWLSQAVSQIAAVRLHRCMLDEYSSKEWPKSPLAMPQYCRNPELMSRKSPGGLCRQLVVCEKGLLNTARGTSPNAAVGAVGLVVLVQRRGHHPPHDAFLCLLH